MRNFSIEIVSHAIEYVNWLAFLVESFESRDHFKANVWIQFIDDEAANKMSWVAQIQ